MREDKSSAEEQLLKRQNLQTKQESPIHRIGLFLLNLILIIKYVNLRKIKNLLTKTTKKQITKN